MFPHSSLLCGAGTCSTPQAFLAATSRHARGVDVNGQRFDSITRAWQTRAHRRGVLGVIGAGLLASLWRRETREARAQGSQGPIRCTDDSECLDGDLDPCTGATCADGSCMYFIVDCIPGSVCCGNGECCPEGEPAACVTDADCGPGSGDPCEGFHCDGGHCLPFLVSCAPGFACCGNGVCCPDHDMCATDADCGVWGNHLWLGARCVGGTCVPHHLT